VDGSCAALQPSGKASGSAAAACVGWCAVEAAASGDPNSWVALSPIDLVCCGENKELGVRGSDPTVAPEGDTKSLKLGCGVDWTAGVAETALSLLYGGGGMKGDDGVAAVEGCALGVACAAPAGVPGLYGDCA